MPKIAELLAHNWTAWIWHHTIRISLVWASPDKITIQNLKKNWKIKFGSQRKRLIKQASIVWSEAVLPFEKVRNFSYISKSSKLKCRKFPNRKVPSGKQLGTSSLNSFAGVCFACPAGLTNFCRTAEHCWRENNRALRRIPEYYRALQNHAE